MARGDAFSAAKFGCSMYGGVLKDIAEEMGMEKALDLHARRLQASGAEIARMMKERLGDKDLDIETLAAVLSDVYQTLGFSFEIEQAPLSLKLTCIQCPFYDGLRSAGVAHETIEALCSHGAVVEFAEESKVFPELSGSLKFRSAPNEPCIDEFVLTR